MLNIELLQKKIDDTQYWDMSILDIQTQYFNDEVYIFIENNEETCWKICFYLVIKSVMRPIQIGEQSIM